MDRDGGARCGNFKQPFQGFSFLALLFSIVSTFRLFALPRHGSPHAFFDDVDADLALVEIGVMGVNLRGGET